MKLHALQVILISLVIAASSASYSPIALKLKPLAQCLYKCDMLSSRTHYYKFCRQHCFKEYPKYIFQLEQEQQLDQSQCLICKDLDRCAKRAWTQFGGKWVNGKFHRGGQYCGFKCVAQCLDEGDCPLNQWVHPQLKNCRHSWREFTNCEVTPGYWKPVCYQDDPRGRCLTKRQSSSPRINIYSDCDWGDVDPYVGRQ